MPPFDERPEEYRPKDETEAEDDLRAPARWWFASTMFPLLAGTFGPVAVAFNVLAISESWRIQPSADIPEQEGSSIPNPHWLTALIALALALGVLTNLLILVHTVQKVTYNASQPFVILGLFVTAWLLIGAVSATAVHLTAEGIVYNQAFYYACLSAALYLILSGFMVLTARAVHHRQYSGDFKLSMPQRTLMFQVICFLTWMLGAGAVYARIEGWAFLDSVYFVEVTLFTIGFGDFSPKTHLGRSLFFPMAIGGILFVGLIISTISALVLASGTKKVVLRSLERARQHAITSPKGRRLLDRSPEKMEHGVDGEAEFIMMRQVQRSARRRNQLMALAVSGGSVCILWFIGAAVFYCAESTTAQWSYFESLYFTYVALITVGYGDFYPQNAASKPVFVFWALLALPTLTVLIGSLGSLISDGVNALVLKIAESPLLEGTKLQAGAAGNKKDDDGAGFKEAKPPGFMEDDAADSHGAGDDVEANALRTVAHGGPNGRTNGPANGMDGEGGGGGHAQKQRQFLLIKEIKNVVNHLDASPPREYTFKEWMWFVTLMGRDPARPGKSVGPDQGKNEAQDQEADAHADAEAAQNQNGNGILGGDGDGDQRGGGVDKWGWLGHGGPLMSAQSEAGYVLSGLLDVLERELKEGELEGKKGGSRGGG